MAGCVNQPYGIVRSHGIEVGSGHITMLSQFALVPARPGYPYAGFDALDFRLHTRKNLSNRRGVRKRDGVKVFHPAIGNVCMRVDQAGSRGATVEVDNTDIWSIAGKFQDFSIASNFHD